MRIAALSSIFWILAACSGDEATSGVGTGASGSGGATSTATGTGGGSSSTGSGGGSTTTSTGTGGGGATTSTGTGGGGGGASSSSSSSSGAGGGGVGVGGVCGQSADGGVCAPGLVCCYPCGIPGCDFVCTVPCNQGDPGCGPGGCILVP